MKNMLCRLLVAVMALAAVTACRGLGADDGSAVLKKRLGDLRRSDEVVVDVRVDTNAVRGLIAEHGAAATNALSGRVLAEIAAATNSLAGSVPGMADRQIAPATNALSRAVDEKLRRIVVDGDMQDQIRQVVAQATTNVRGRLDMTVYGDVDLPVITASLTGQSMPMRPWPNAHHPWRWKTIEPLETYGHATITWFSDGSSWGHDSPCWTLEVDSGMEPPWAAAPTRVPAGTPPTNVVFEVWNLAVTAMVTLSTRQEAVPLEDTGDRLATTGQVMRLSSTVSTIDGRVSELEVRMGEMSETLWTSPESWTVGFQPDFEYKSSESAGTEEDESTGIFLENATVEKRQLMRGVVYSKPLDTSSLFPAPGVSLSYQGAGLTINGVRVQASTPGTYEVQITADDGSRRTLQVPMLENEVLPCTESKYVYDYVELRRRANEDMQAVLIASDTNFGEPPLLQYPTDNGRSPPGEFKAWHTVSPAWAWPGSGDRTPWAVASKVLVAPSPSSTIGSEFTLWDAAGASNFTVRVGGWDRLDTWAVSNNHSVADLAQAGLQYILLGHIVEGEVPDACLPYLCSSAWFSKYAGGTLDRVMAWLSPRGVEGGVGDVGYPYCIPVVLTMSDASQAMVGWTEAAYITLEDRVRVRADVLDLIGALDVGRWWRVRYVDRGRPVFVRWRGNGYSLGPNDEVVEVPVSMVRTSSSGCNIPVAAPLIKAYCTAHGCTPKTLEE